MSKYIFQITGDGYSVASKGDTIQEALANLREKIANEISRHQEHLVDLTILSVLIEPGSHDADN